jgi:mycothiol synthase
MSITDIIITVIIRSAAPADLPAIQGLCARSLDLEPDAGDLPLFLQTASAGLAVVAEADGEIIGVCHGGPGRPIAGTPRGHVDLLAVAPEYAGRGAGRLLLAEMEERLRRAGAAQVVLAANPPVYVWPGIDVRYTAMTCLAERAGYERYREAVDMAVDPWSADLDVQADERRLALAGITVRRATSSELGPVVAWLRSGPWGQSAWPDEVALALGSEPARCHLARRDDDYVGFACHGVVRPGRFGPMGTMPAERQHGIGSVLLRRCLADIRSAGGSQAVIGWVGPARFYARTVGARMERVYWLYRKAV